MKAIFEIVILALFFAHPVYPQGDEVDYYENLIIQNTVQTSTYQRPEFCSEFNVRNTDEAPVAIGSYDFVVVGGGLAGSVIAGRLTERPDVSVLVLEAGKRENDYVDIPAMDGFLKNSEYNWGFRTVPQKVACRDQPGFRCDYPRGKIYGGSTGINGLANIRGNWRDYDKWAAMGNKGWSFDDVLPYFKKYENASSLVGIDAEYHGFSGPVTLENYKTPSNITKTFMEAMGLFGYPITDYNAKNLFGINYNQFTQRNGRRLTSAAAYLFPNEDRKNLKVKTECYVTHILMDQRGKRTNGVEFIHNNRKYIVTATKEVIMAAGSIQTPQIMMLSGLGPKEQLDKFSIPVLKNLPVGKNMLDQFYVQRAMNVTTNYTEEKRTIRSDVVQYLQGFGRLTINVGNIEAIGFIEHKRYPVTEINVIPTSAVYAVENKEVRITGGKYAVAQAGGILLHAKSVGQVTLQSADPLDFPLIDPNYLTEEDDMNALVETLDFLVDVYESGPLQKYNTTVVPESTYCKDYEFRSFDYWKCVIQHYGTTIYHPVATCKMGQSHETSVVNDKLLVHGTENLRIVDASVIPSSISGHLMPAVYMVAEKAADIIKHRYRKTKSFDCTTH
ncbi:glucose dehydrogenase [FAD, quinone]-like [Agrilus planipennis]|uniref:Glucose dehydrogenase [FAD, quinone] n=1 Tax=Agrilus planipennis TaxID=224129 RepID=A0A1W4XFL0_AGRPL|nr:glucose dehydrogenase [FAD, quinone] [Agrilus planipennis]XP_025829704.1 glucose dehydrogenase [FAD, quinone]-like [Agrilus planipennis]